MKKQIRINTFQSTENCDLQNFFSKKLSNLAHIGFIAKHHFPNISENVANKSKRLFCFLFFNLFRNSSQIGMNIYLFLYTSNP